MKFDNLYSDDPPNNLIKSQELGSCWICGCYTHWIDINNQCFICSEECQKRAGEMK